MSAAGSEGISPRKARVSRKPKAVKSGGFLQVIAPASPGNAQAVIAGLTELERLRFRASPPTTLAPEGYFAGPLSVRRDELLSGMADDRVDALVAVRGGYGSNYLLEGLELPRPDQPKVVLGYSDLTSLQIYLWQSCSWVGFYGPMVAAGFSAGPGAAKGYDRESLLAALQNTDGGWGLGLRGETLVAGDAEGIVLGGCLTLVETSLGTPWELDTAGTILVLEDRGMKPWQVDRALMHLKQAGKFEHVEGIVLGDFPECEAPLAGSPTVRDVCERILGRLEVPIIYGAPVGHTMRPMLTVPLGVQARLAAKGDGVLEILEPAVVA
jgi:muramoyltetrapeptide carboxypeptidase